VYELHVSIGESPLLIARIDELESACHLAQLLRMTSGFRTSVRTPDGTVIGEHADCGMNPRGIAMKEG
jgi:hypothetical protein